jgi:hypothetical protein
LELAVTLRKEGHMNRYTMLLATVVTLLSSGFLVAQDDCAVLKDNSSPDTFVSFLDQSLSRAPQQRDAGCVVFAIRHLEYQWSPRAEAVLLRYLDFQRALSHDERIGFTSHGPLGISELYPAVSTLSTFGERIVPSLLGEIKESDSSTVRRNASYTLIEIYREHPEKAIATMRTEAVRTDNSGAERLMSAVHDSIRWCGKRHKAECDAASAGQ